MKKNSIASGLFWKMLERFGVQGSSFFLSIILARLLTPDLYGVLALMLIFTSFANIFVQNGLNTALVREKDVDESDYSSVFWISFFIGTVLYIAFFFAAPFIEQFYDVEGLATPFRLLTLVLLPGAFNSVQMAKVSRNLDFKCVFKSHLLSVLLSGFLGVCLAYNGAGLWSLVIKEISNSFLNCFFLSCYVRWFPSFSINWVRLKKFFSFGWKVLLTVLVDNIYNDLRSLVIGKKYSAATLGVYDRGRQFPQFLINGVNGAVQSVMLPAYAKKQDDKNAAFLLMRTSVSVTCYILIPLMTILAASGQPVIKLLLSETWMPALPYMQIYCLVLCNWPLHTCNVQMINAMGRSDIVLKIEIIKKSIGLLGLFVAILLFDSPIAIAVSAAITSFIDILINAFPNKYLVGYSPYKQIKDLCFPYLVSIIMFVMLNSIDKFFENEMLFIVANVILGTLFYTVVSTMFKPKPFCDLLLQIKVMRKG